MAASILTLFCSNGVQSGSSAGLLALSAPGASTSTTGWTVSTGATNYSRQSFAREKAATTFAAAQQPSGAPAGSADDCWRISAQTTGQFSTGTWYSSVSVIGVSSGGDHDGRALFRVWRAANADGTSATEISSSIMTGSLIANLSTTVAQSSVASFNLASASNVTNEYLFLQVAWQRTGAGGATTRDVLIRLGSMTAANGSGLVTSAFSSITPVSGAGGGAYYMMRKTTDAMTSYDEV